MTRQLMLRTATDGRRQPLLEDYSTRGGGGVRKVRVAEVAGGTAAECLAVCCCCPCGLVNLLVLAVYKVPAGLCRMALRRKRHRRLMKSGTLLQPRAAEELHVASPLAVVNASSEISNEAVELEKEMWDKFYGAGFWRSPSQRSSGI